MGIPVIVIAHDDHRALTFVLSALIFVVFMATLLLMFVPKIKYVMAEARTFGNRRSTVHVSGCDISASHGMHDSSRVSRNQFDWALDYDFDGRSTSGASTVSEVGLSVIRHPKLAKKMGNLLKSTLRRKREVEEELKEERAARLQIQSASKRILKQMSQKGLVIDVDNDVACELGKLMGGDDDENDVSSGGCDEGIKIDVDPDMEDLLENDGDEQPENWVGRSINVAKAEPDDSGLDKRSQPMDIFDGPTSRALDYEERNRSNSQ